MKVWIVESYDLYYDNDRCIVGVFDSMEKAEAYRCEGNSIAEADESTVFYTITVADVQ